MARDPAANYNRLLLFPPSTSRERDVRLPVFAKLKPPAGNPRTFKFNSAYLSTLLERSHLPRYAAQTLDYIDQRPPSGTCDWPPAGKPLVPRLKAAYPYSYLDESPLPASAAKRREIVFRRAALTHSPKLLSGYSDIDYTTYRRPPSRVRTNQSVSLLNHCKLDLEVSNFDFSASAERALRTTSAERQFRREQVRVEGWDIKLSRFDFWASAERDSCKKSSSRHPEAPNTMHGLAQFMYGGFSSRAPQLQRKDFKDFVNTTVLSQK
ncbi:hypothetical protein R3P38DRAFT_3253479 [Favolaschia claudopus]|uniref:Uncharacterized protein n=1 Tax=Favolaschia claudopus TaxID=2862362 RepID=A0AAW0DV72_9AGAR